jgi:hypothetical protein
MEKYFYLKNKKQYGPCTIDELKKRSIGRNTMIWTEGMEEWLPIEEVPEVASQLPPPVPQEQNYVRELIINLVPSKGITNGIIWALFGILVFIFIARSCNR